MILVIQKVSFEHVLPLPLDYGSDGCFWYKMVRCCPLVRQALTPKPAEHNCLKLFSVTSSFSLRGRSWFLCPKLIWPWWYLLYATHFVQQQVELLICCNTDQQPTLLTENNLVPCGMVLLNTYYETFYLGLSKYITSINNSHLKQVSSFTPV